MDRVKLPLLPRNEFEGRMLENAFGIAEKSILPKACWVYYDWCAGQGFDMNAWVKHIDELRKPQLSFSENLFGCLWKDECDRYRRGDPCPPSSPPEGYQE